MCKSMIGTSVESIASYILSNRKEDGCDSCLSWLSAEPAVNPVIIAMSRLETILEDPHQREQDKYFFERLLVRLMVNAEEDICFDYVDEAYAILVRTTYALSDESRKAIAWFENEPENAITVEKVQRQQLGK